MSSQAAFLRWRISTSFKIPPPPPKLQEVVMAGDIFSRLLNWLQSAITLVALFWLSYRTYQVFARPVEQLIGSLGMETPEPPSASIIKLKMDGAVLRLNLPDEKNPAVHYFLLVNGDLVAMIFRQETIAIVGLQPGRLYTARILAHHDTGFNTGSEPIRFSTLPRAPTAEDLQSRFLEPFGERPRSDTSIPPTIEPHTESLETLSIPVLSPALARDHGGSHNQSKKNNINRRPSPSVGLDPPPKSITNTTEGDESVQQLTAKLESLRQETEEVERQISDEKKEFEGLKSTLAKKSTELRQSLKRREAESREQKRRIAELEKTGAIAQNKKNAQERLLQESKKSRNDLKENIIVWDREANELKHKTLKYVEEMKNNRILTMQRIQDMRDSQAEQIEATKLLEEQIKSVGIAMEDLKEIKKKNETNESETEGSGDGKPYPESQSDEWNDHLATLQARYSIAWADLQQAHAIYLQVQQGLEQRRASQPLSFPPSPALEESLDRRTGLRRRRTGVSRPESTYAAGNAFAALSPVPYISGLVNLSPNLTISTMPPGPLFQNMRSGASFGRSAVNLADDENSVIGGPISPTAGNLLPAGLLGDEGTVDPPKNEDPSPGRRKRSSLLPGLVTPLPGLGAPQALEHSLCPSSPASIHSPSPRYVTPRDSSGHLPLRSAAETSIESDRRSVKSLANSIRAASGPNTSTSSPGTRFGGIFGLSRQRGKTLPDEGPPLGSLKSSQTLSLPRSDLDPDMIESGRRRGNSGTWVGQVSSALSRHPILPGKSGLTFGHRSLKEDSARKRPFTLFNTKADPWLLTAADHNGLVGTRPMSSSARDGTSLRLGSESAAHSAWSNDGLVHNSEWGPTATSSSPWPLQTSRRTSLSSNTFATLLEADDLNIQRANPNPQAPIGTPSDSSKATKTLQLDPTAPQFKSLFTRDRKTEKADKDKSKSKTKDRPSDLAAAQLSADTSPPNSRKSKDGPGLAELSDTNESRSSLERVISNPSVESLGQWGSSSNLVGKETFMQKLSRKSSLNKFNLPGFKSKDSLVSSNGFPSSGKRDGKAPSSATETASTDEDHATKGGESLNGSPQIGTPTGGGNRSNGLSWSSLKRKGKKGGESAPSISESTESETAEEED